MKRIRFSSDPPYSSRRRFVYGDQELADQVAVSGVYFDGVESGFAASFTAVPNALAIPGISFLRSPRTKVGE